VIDAHTLLAAPSASLLPWLQQLGLHSLVISATVGMVLALRGPARRHCGASLLRPIWAAVPLVLVALLLVPLLSLLLHPLLKPQWATPLQALVQTVHWQGMAVPGAALVGLVPRPAAGLFLAALAGLWALGAMAVLVLMWQRQQRYLRLLQGDPRHGVCRAPAGHSPAQLGLWRSRLVLPLDFEQRFSADEQALVLAHEQAHLHHHDNVWNLLAALLCALHWFNPMVWWAARAWRQDAELVCDAAVLQADPGARDTYARALLKSHSPQTWQAVLAAPWWPRHRSAHPLVERVRMLNTPAPSPFRRQAGLLLGWGLAALCAGAAVTAQAAVDNTTSAAQVDLQLRVLVNGLPAGEPRLLAALGQPATVTLAPDDKSAPGDTAWQIETTTTALPDGSLQLDNQVRHGDPLTSWGHTKITAAPGETRQWFISDERGGQVLYVYQTAQLATTGQVPAPPPLPVPPSAAAPAAPVPPALPAAVAAPAPPMNPHVVAPPAPPAPVLGGPSSSAPTGK
jgi:beta-lactamase regulating signal transducer with metallopeptidase domain